MTRGSRFLGTLALFGLFTACGDSGGTSGDTMTTNEIGEVTGVLVAPMFAAVFGVTLAPPALAAAAAAPIQQSIPCDAGGNLNITGDVTDTGSGGTADITETISGCKTVVDSVTFALAGDPDITMSGSGTDSTASMSFGGGFTYTTDDGREGGCGVNVDLTLSGLTASFSGTVCGVDVTELTDDIMIGL